MIDAGLAQPQCRLQRSRRNLERAGPMIGRMSVAGIATTPTPIVSAAAVEAQCKSMTMMVGEHAPNFREMT